MTLPDTMHELLELAIADAEKLDRGSYTPDAAFYHDVFDNDYPRDGCHVCLAGMVIAGTLRAPDDADAHPGDYGAFTKRKLKSIDLMRGGHWRAAHDEIYYDKHTELRANLQKWGITEFSNSCFVGWVQFDLFIAEIKPYIAKLKELGA